MKRNNALSLWGDIGSLHRGIDRWFEETMSFNPPVDVEETEDQYILNFDLPGVAKEDVKIELHDNQIFVTGERKYSKDEEGKTRHFAERYHGTFQRSFGFPAKVDADKIEAAYKDGVLTVIVPKSEAAKPRSIQIGEGKSGLFTKLLGSKEKKESAA